MRGRAAAGAAAVVALVAVLAACEGGAAGSAPTATADAAAARSAGPATLTVATFARTVVSAATRASSFDFTLAKAEPGAGLTAQGSADFRDTPSIDLYLQNGGGAEPVEVRVIGDTTYASLRAATGGKFFVVDENESDREVLLAEDLVEEVDPAQTVDGLRTEITSVTAVGEPVKLADGPAQAYAVVVHSATYLFLVGFDGLLREEQWTVDGLRTTLRFTNWNKGAPVDEPTAEQLTSEPAAPAPADGSVAPAA